MKRSKQDHWNAVASSRHHILSTDHVDMTMLGDLDDSD